MTAACAPPSSPKRFSRAPPTRAAGCTDQELAAARGFQRKAQFYLDFVEAENTNGFHASQEAVRILGESINFTRLGQAALRGGAPAPSPSPVQQPAASH